MLFGYVSSPVVRNCGGIEEYDDDFKICCNHYVTPKTDTIDACCGKHMNIVSK